MSAYFRYIFHKSQVRSWICQVFILQLLLNQCSLLVWRRRADFVVFCCCFYRWDMKAMPGLRVDVLCDGTQGPSPSILHLKASARLLSSFLPVSASRLLPLQHTQPRILSWGLTPTNLLLKVELVSWFPFWPASVFWETNLTVSMPAQKEGDLHFRLSSASVTLAPMLTKGKDGGNFLLFIDFTHSHDRMESNTLSPPLTATAKTRNQNQYSSRCSCNTV